MATQSVKLYANGEIRRFAIGLVDGKAKFENLSQKVNQLYPDLSAVKLAWKDSDGDMVAIMNDDDLSEAVKNATGDVLQIYLAFREKRVTFVDEQPIVEKVADQEVQVRKKPKAAKVPSTATDSAPKEEQDPMVHVGITCDACGGIVRGLRFKCLTCPDYDLCESCESKHSHDEHPMIRIESPQDKSWMRGYFAAKIPLHPRRHMPWRRSFHHGRPGFGCGSAAEPCQQAPEPTEEPAITKKPVEEEVEDDFLLVQKNVGAMITDALAAMGLEPQSNDETTKEAVDPTIHNGVRCDGCKGIVKGLRYKCLTCPNYDLCDMCQSKHMHDEHAMIRIVSPSDKSWMKGFYATQSPFPHRHGHGRRSFQSGPSRCHFGGPGGPGRCHQEGLKCDESERVPRTNKIDCAGHEFIPFVGEVISNVLASMADEPQTNQVVEQQQQRRHGHHCGPSGHHHGHRGHHSGHRRHPCGHHGAPQCGNEEERNTCQRKPTNEELPAPNFGQVLSTMLASLGLEPQSNQDQKPTIPTAAATKQNEAQADAFPKQHLENLQKAMEQLLSMGFSK